MGRPADLGRRAAWAGEMSLDRFAVCLNFVLEREGGFTDDPVDRGGATNMGITQKEYDVWSRAQGIERRSVANIARAEAAMIYRQDYWDACRCSLLPDGVDLFVFDSAVQHGVKWAIRLLQRALGVDDDGVMGQQTMSALHEDMASGRSKDLLADCAQVRHAYYTAILKARPEQEKFRRGWMNRMVALERAMGTVA